MNRDRPLTAVGRFVKWQIQCRLQDEVIHEWIGGSKLAVRKGMTGATGNIYWGLHEYVDMSSVLHVLRPGDLFVDVGANVGSYTVLAAAVAGADVIAFEPDPDTARYLRRNVAINNIADRVEIHECALGAAEGSISFTVGRDTVNKVASYTDANTRLVRIEKLDAILNGREPTLIKLDVEGFEQQVLAG
jgi:FkbM family methyltransferase